MKTNHKNISIGAIIVLLAGLYWAWIGGLILSPDSETLTATRIIDGDTFETSDNRTIRVLGIDTPERGETGFTEATDEMKELVLGKEIRLDCLKKDYWLRDLCFVFVGELDIAQKMIEEGHSEWVDPY